MLVENEFLDRLHVLFHHGLIVAHFQCHAGVFFTFGFALVAGAGGGGAAGFALTVEPQIDRDHGKSLGLEIFGETVVGLPYEPIAVFHVQQHDDCGVFFGRRSVILDTNVHAIFGLQSMRLRRQTFGVRLFLCGASGRRRQDRDRHPQSRQQGQQSKLR